MMSTQARERQQSATENFISMGAPEALARRMSTLTATRAALDIADLAAEYKREVLASAKVYSAFNEHLDFHWFHASVEDLEVQGRWQAAARSNLREEFYRLRRDLASQLLKSRSKRDIADRIDDWMEKHADPIDRFRRMSEEMRVRGDIDFATLSVAAQNLRALIHH